MSDLIPRMGRDPDCKHPNMTREYVDGYGRLATYLHYCPDCDYREVEGWEGEDE